MLMPDPVAFSIGAMEVRWYGVFVCLGVLGAYMILQWRAKKLGIDTRKMEIIFYAALLVGLAGARFTHVVTYLRPELARDPMVMFRVWEGGLVSYGGFIGGTLGVIIAIRLLKMDTWAVGDSFALAMPLGQAFGRIGCLLNGCCHGGIAGDGAFYVRYPEIFGHFVPSQLYQSGINIVIFAILFWLSFRIKVKGRILGLLMVLYGVGRFLNEYNRGDYEAERMIGAFTPAQVVAMLFFAGGCIILGILARSKNVYTPPTSGPSDGEPTDDEPATKSKKKPKSTKSRGKHA